MEYTISYNFSRLKPVCDNIALHARVEDIVELKQIIKELDEYSLKSMLMYVIFPFKILLIRRNNEVVTITAIDFLSYLFEKCGIENWSIFSGCFEQLSNLLLMPGKEIKVSVGSEEFKSSVCLCISSLVKTSKEEIVNEMYQIAFRLPFAQIFYTLVHLLKNEKSKSLRKIVLQTIGVLTFNSNHLQLQSEAVKQSASYALAGLFQA
ncbi:TELO2-interacting protein 1 [Caerostris extrusa]|uniref:TELO2-interacting protein 1 n=1 Tax=Caerostris extrusa TaxID=172846 RepID=A0AAV4WJ09_CAEEX|nr:TELO2-interacting protein 1 [Caerostris extrusa]